ncbi:UNVERIFIED_CONTAM: hypothetical protein HHA_453980 [Hammondia hammondi]|eukprot:XP_008887383.1 hypothetical protein HHA_453980 [Hammondia hammondi]
MERRARGAGRKKSRGKNEEPLDEGETVERSGGTRQAQEVSECFYFQTVIKEVAVRERMEKGSVAGVVTRAEKESFSPAECTNEVSSKCESSCVPLRLRGTRPYRQRRLSEARRSRLRFVASFVCLSITCRDA